MSNNPIPPEDQDTETPSPRAQISGLVSDVRTLAEAEWQYAKARLSYSGGIMRKAGIYAIAAILALSAAAIALVIGLLLIVASYWGLWIATALVVLLFSLSAYMLAVMARNTARNLRFAEDNHDA